MEDKIADSPWLWPAHAGLASTRWIRQHTLDSPAHTELAVHVCFSAVRYRTEFIWSKHDETSAVATEAAMASSKDERICLKDWMW